MSKKKTDTKAQAIRLGVRDLQAFGYLDVTEENITTDLVYRMFFRRSLVDTIYDAEGAGRDATELKELIAEIDANEAAELGVRE